MLEQTQKNVPDSSQTRSCHESETFNVGDKTLRERTVRPVVDHDNLSHEQTMLNEADMDFRIPGLPHSFVKHAQSTSIRELIQKVENHPDRHALQQDLRQNQSFNPFSPESKQRLCSSRSPRASRRTGGAAPPRSTPSTLAYCTDIASFAPAELSCPSAPSLRAGFPLAPVGGEAINACNARTCNARRCHQRSLAWKKTGCVWRAHTVS